MNIFSFLPMYLPFLDVAFGPSFSENFNGDAIDPVTKVILVVVLLLFLSFIGYLIYNSLKKKK